MLKKSQAGIEYIMLVGILLIFLIPVIHFSVSDANVQIKINQLDNTARRLAKATNSVYAIGPGAQQVVVVTVPRGVTFMNATGKEVLYQTTLFGQTSDFHYPIKGVLNGTLPVLPGTYRILVIARDGGVVDVRTRQIS